MIVMVLIIFALFVVLPIEENEKAGIVMLLAIPVYFITLYITAKFLLFRRIFKSGSSFTLGLPEPQKTLSRYTWRWLGISAAIQIILSILMGVIEKSVPLNPGVGIGIAIGANFAATSCVLYRMIKNGFVTVEANN